MPLEIVANRWVAVLRGDSALLLLSVAPHRTETPY
jgi:hypothetical protein